MKSYHNSTAVRFYRNLFPSAQRSSDAAVTHCSCMSPDLRINTQIPPSQDISAAVRKLVSVVYGKRVPLLQWRDRAGLTPASILAFVKFAVIPKPEAAATWRKNINAYVIVNASIAHSAVLDKRANFSAQPKTTGLPRGEIRCFFRGDKHRCNCFRSTRLSWQRRWTSVRNTSCRRLS